MCVRSSPALARPTAVSALSPCRQFLLPVRSLSPSLLPFGPCPRPSPSLAVLGRGACHARGEGVSVGEVRLQPPQPHAAGALRHRGHACECAWPRCSHWSRGMASADFDRAAAQSVLDAENATAFSVKEKEKEREREREKERKRKRERERKREKEKEEESAAPGKKRAAESSASSACVVLFSVRVRTTHTWSRLCGADGPPLAQRVRGRGLAAVAVHHGRPSGIGTPELRAREDAERWRPRPATAPIKRPFGSGPTAKAFPAGTEREAGRGAEPGAPLTARHAPTAGPTHATQRQAGGGIWRLQGRNADQRPRRLAHGQPRWLRGRRVGRLGGRGLGRVRRSQRPRATRATGARPGGRGPRSGSIRKCRARQRWHQQRRPEPTHR